jgi:membrane-bound lytic murein transglycosylase D
MKSALIILLVCTFAGAVVAQERPSPLDDLFKSAEQWARENLDEDVLDVLKQTDQVAVRALFKEMDRRLQNENVYDLGQLKGTATKLLPLLRDSRETRPYAAWLESHLDYLDAASELLRRMRRPPPRPGAPAPPPAPPSPEAQRSVWDKEMEKRPLPVGAQTYVPRLKPVFLAGGMPAELVWLAEVESSFNPEARSPVGAAGLFQFMPATAKSLGLSLAPRDERLDPEKSARAAAKYLRYLHVRFSDWRLTFAAYNAGETRVANLLTQLKTRSYYTIAPKLPSETQLYVPKIEATLRKREGMALTGLQVPRN